MAEFDLNSDSVRDLNQFLHDTTTGNSTVTNPGGRHCIACGVDAPLDVTVEGHVGYYCAGMNKNAAITITGNAGPGVAENIMSGTVRVRGVGDAPEGSNPVPPTLEDAYLLMLGRRTRELESAA